MKRDEVLAKLRELKPIYERRGLQIVGLFGSFARGEENENSDIDVAITIDDNYLAKNDVWDYFDAINTLKSEISKELGRKIDIFDIKGCSFAAAKVRSEILYV